MGFTLAGSERFWLLTSRKNWNACSSLPSSANSLRIVSSSFCTGSYFFLNLATTVVAWSYWQVAK